MSSEKRLQALIISYLESKKASVSDPDSIDVAIECLAEAFGVQAADKEGVSGQNLLAIFEKGAGSAGSAATSASSSKDPTEDTPVYRKYIDSLKKAGFFGDAEEGSAAYNEKLAKAKDKWLKQQAAAPAAAAAAAAPAAAANDEAGAEAAKAKGNDCITAGRHKEAVECYSEAISKAPTGKNVHIYYCNRAAAKTSLGDHSGAAEDARASIAANPSFAKAHSRLGAALMSQGSYADAVASFEKCLQLDPSNDVARENLRACREKLSKASAVSPSSSSSGSAASSAPPAGGMPGGGGLPAGLGGLGDLMNNPMMQGLMSNPAVMNAAQSLMSDPAKLQQMLGALGGAGGAGGGLGGLASMFGGAGAGGRGGGGMGGGGGSNAHLDDEDD